MKSKLKIVIVGGGSYTWGPKLINDIVHTPELEGSELVLLDINLIAAKELTQVARTLIKKSNRKIKVYPTNNEFLAFRQADFVIITISTGGLKAMSSDIEIPEKYGIFQTVGDTVGPGGWSRALRNIPVFVKLAQRIEELSPRAVVLNYTNPMSILTRALCYNTNLRVVGLCHGLFETYRRLEDIFGVEEKDIRIKFGGINHFFWILDFTIKGKPGYPLLRRKLGGKKLHEYIHTIVRAIVLDEAGFGSDVYLWSESFETYGYLSYDGDRHTCEFFPQFLTPHKSVLRKYKLVRTSVDERIKANRLARARALRIATGKEEPGGRSRETAVDIMKSIACNEEFIDVVNLPNEGQIDNVPRGAIVETLGVVNGQGFTPLVVGPLPEILRRLVEPHIVCQELTFKAAIEGNREKALIALISDPLCSHLTPDKVREMGNELMSANRKLLPQFFG